MTTEELPASIRLSTRDWIYLLTLVLGAALTTIGGQFKIKMDMMEQMTLLDGRWQSRTEALSMTVRGEIQDVRKSIPPDWFRAMVEENRARTTALEKEHIDMEKRITKLEVLSK